MTYNELKEEINQGNYFEVFEFLSDFYEDFPDDDKTVFHSLRKEYMTGVYQNDIHFMNRLKMFASGVKQFLKANNATTPSNTPNKGGYEKWMKLGNSYQEVQQYEKAVEAYTKAIDVKPDSDDAWNCLAITYKKLKNYEKASEAYHQALEVNPEASHIWYNLG